MSHSPSFHRPLANRENCTSSASPSIQSRINQRQRAPRAAPKPATELELADAVAAGKALLLLLLWCLSRVLINVAARSAWGRFGSPPRRYVRLAEETKLAIDR